MARENNFLLGNGERLTKPEDKLFGGRPKKPPYTFGEARERLSRKLRETVAENAKLKPEVCPNGEAVAVITMHPRYISKSDYPGALLNEVGLRPVGNRIREITPEKWGTKKPPSTPMPGEDIFVAGQRAAFAQWSRDIDHWHPIGMHNRIVSIEEIGAFPADAKIRALPETPGKEVLLEVVLHNAGSREIPEAFYAYADRIGARPLPELSRKVKGLRVDGKWETCRRQGKKYGPGKLNNPFFHIDCQHRRGIGRESNPKPIPYVLVVSVKAEGINTFYNMIATKYSHILVPMKPVLDVAIPLQRG